MKHLLSVTLLLVGVIQGAAAQAQLSLTLTPVNHNGFEISCNGGQDGAIDLTVTGGTPPYLYLWTTGDATQDISGLSAGYYEVVVRDANGWASGGITLTEPEMVQSAVYPVYYPGQYNISCHNCYNGSVQLQASGGVAPYTYLWNDGNTQQNRSNMGAGNYSVDITDANGCVTNTGTFYLNQPERTDWTMNGNTGTNPATQYIGTSDNKDVVFKSNGTEALRILSAGKLRAPSMSFAQGYKLVMIDSLGTLKAYDENEIEPGRLGNCPQYNTIPWTLCGNYIDGDQFIGTTNASPLRFRTNDSLRMVITSWGKVGIGVHPAQGAVDGYRLFVEDGIATRDVLVKTGAWPDYVFDPRYELMPMDELRAFLSTNRHLPGIPSAAEVEEKKGVEVGDLQTKMLKVIEEQALYILQLEERMKGMESRVSILETTK